MERLSRLVREHHYTELRRTAATVTLRRRMRGQTRGKIWLRRLVSACSILFLAVRPAVASAQSPVILDSAAVVARGLPSVGKPFAELKDGRLLTHSATDKVVLLIDPRRGTFDTLGRDGHGPGEYSTPLAAAVLTDGRIALVDLHNLRLTIWKADKKLNSIVAVPFFALHFDADLDGDGRVYWEDIPANSPAFLGPADRRGRHPDSSWSYRLKPPSERYDTVGFTHTATRRLDRLRVQAALTLRSPGRVGSAAGRHHLDCASPRKPDRPVAPWGPLANRHSTAVGAYSHLRYRCANGAGPLPSPTGPGIPFRHFCIGRS